MKSLLLLIFISTVSLADSITYDKKGFKINGKYSLIRGGTLQWFRLPESEWEDRIKRVKAAGFNTIDMYVPWSLVEPKPGVFNFHNPNMFKFIELIDKHGLYIYFRPGPYITNEMDAGGIPQWMIKDTTKTSRKLDGLISLRDNDPDFLELVENYFNAVNDAVKPYLSTNGGPIIFYALENEYDYFEDFAKVEKLFVYAGRPERGPFYKPDTNGYFTALRDMVIEDGIDVVLTTCPGKNVRGTGNVPGILPLPNLYIKEKVDWNVWNDLNLMHDSKNFDGAYTNYPSGITEADRYPALMKRLIIGGMDAFFAFNFVGMSQTGYQNGVSMSDMDVLKLFSLGSQDSFLKVGYFHNVYDYHGIISASGGVREKFHGFRRANLFLNSFEEEIARSLHSLRSGKNPRRGEVLDSRVQISNDAVGANEDGRRRHYFIDSNGTYFLSLLNESNKTIQLERESIEIDGYRFPRFTTMTLPTEIDDPLGNYSHDLPENFNSSILVYNSPISDGLRLHYTTSDILYKGEFNSENLLIVYGKKDSQGEIRFETNSPIEIVSDSRGVKIEENSNGFITFSYDHALSNIFLRGKEKTLRLLVLNRYDAGRTWFTKVNDLDALVIGPEYVDFGEGTYMEFSDFYKSRNITMISSKKLVVDGLEEVGSYNSKTGVSRYTHSRNFEFPNFKADLNIGVATQDISESNLVFNTGRGITHRGMPRSLEDLGITGGHAWYRTTFDIENVSRVKTARLFIEHASDFVGVYVNGHYVTTVAPLGTEIDNEHRNALYKFDSFVKHLVNGKNVIAFRVEVWGHGSFMFPKGKLASNFAQIPALGFDSRKGLFGKADITLGYKFGKTKIDFDSWWVRPLLGGEIKEYYATELSEDTWLKTKLPIKLKPGEILWYRTSFSKDDMPKTSRYHAPMVLSINGRAAKGTIFLNGVIIGRWLSDNESVNRGSWIEARRDMWASVNPDHFPVYASALRDNNVLAIAFEDISPSALSGGVVDKIEMLHNQERWAAKDQVTSKYHMLREIRVETQISQK